jgi:hypothetical protein
LYVPQLFGFGYWFGCAPSTAARTGRISFCTATVSVVLTGQIICDPDVPARR